MSVVHKQVLGALYQYAWLKNVQPYRLDWKIMGSNQDPDGEIENSGKKYQKIQIPNFCYIQVIAFDLSYLPVAAVGTQ